MVGDHKVLSTTTAIRHLLSGQAIINLSSRCHAAALLVYNRRVQKVSNSNIIGNYNIAGLDPVRGKITFGTLLMLTKYIFKCTT